MNTSNKKNNTYVDKYINNIIKLLIKDEEFMIMIKEIMSEMNYNEEVKYIIQDIIIHFAYSFKEELTNDIIINDNDYEYANIEIDKESLYDFDVLLCSKSEEGDIIRHYTIFFNNLMNYISKEKDIPINFLKIYKYINYNKSKKIIAILKKYILDIEELCDLLVIF